MKLFFDHIPKTAGTSLQMFFSEAFGPENTTEVLRNLKPNLATNLYCHCNVIIGHFDFIIGDSLPEGYITATLLRDPRERTLSDYYYQCFDVPKHNLSPLELRIISLPIDEVFSDKECLQRFTNYQAIHFASFFHPTPQQLPSEELLHLAKKGLEQYNLVGTTERLQEFVDEIKRIFKLPPDIKLKRANITSTRKRFSELPQHIQKRIEEINEVDMELWRYANYLFENKTKQFHIQPMTEEKTKKEPTYPDQGVKDFGDGSLELLGVNVTNYSRQGLSILSGEEVCLNITFRAHVDIDDLTIGYSIHHDSGLNLFGTNTRLLGHHLSCKAGRDYNVNFIFTANLGLGAYWINVSAHSGLTHLERCYFWKEKVAKFFVDGFIGMQFEGLIRLLPKCVLDPKLEVNVGESIKKFTLIEFNTPEVENPKGYIYICETIPPIRPGDQFSVSVEVSNTGSEDWVSEGINAVYISYHWRAENGNIVVWDGIRTPFPFRLLRAGDVARVYPVIEAPHEEGSFILEITIVQENICWFETKGFKTGKAKVIVRK